VIDEIDYDQPGSDTAEWIEIRLDWIDLYPLNGVSLVLYDVDLNGNCTEYCRVDLSVLAAMGPEQRILIGAHPAAELPLCASTDAIQNGAPDAIAIEVDGTVMHSVQYASELIQSACSFSFTDVADSDVFEGSIQRCWSTWQFVRASTPGMPNDCSTTDVSPLPVETWGTIKGLYR
jgi:hypothetical protein